MADDGQQFLDWAYDLGFQQAGVHPAWRHAHRETKIMPLHDGSFSTEAEQRAWQDAVDGYQRLHPQDGSPHDPREFAKWRAHQAKAALEMAAAAEPGSEPFVLEWLRDPQDHHRHRGLVGFLLETRTSLLAAFSADDASRTSALALAKQWSGPGLEREVLACLDADHAEDPSVHLVALAVLTMTRLRTT